MPGANPVKGKDLRNLPARPAIRAKRPNPLMALVYRRVLGFVGQQF